MVSLLKKMFFSNQGNKKQRMDRAAVVDGETNGDKKEADEDECLFDSDSSLPEIPDAPSTPVEKRKFSAEQIFKYNSVLLIVCTYIRIYIYIYIYIYICMNTHVHNHTLAHTHALVRIWSAFACKYLSHVKSQATYSYASKSIELNCKVADYFYTIN